LKQHGQPNLPHKTIRTDEGGELWNCQPFHQCALHPPTRTHRSRSPISERAGRTPQPHLKHHGSMLASLSGIRTGILVFCPPARRVSQKPATTRCDWPNTVLPVHGKTTICQRTSNLWVPHYRKATREAAYQVG
jgi:hypothetical protein